MGCDIHLHLEYRHHKQFFTPVISSDFFVSQDYRLFAVLAGVRNRDRAPVRFAPRSLPDDVSQDILKRFFMRVIPDNAKDWQKNLSQAWCYESEVKKYVEQYNCLVKEYDGVPHYVSEPDWHNPSYLTRHEIIEACQYSGYDLSQAPAEFQIVVDFMKLIDDRFGHDVSRIVFWFDN